jgi:hypothetical protein
MELGSFIRQHPWLSATVLILVFLLGGIACGVWATVARRKDD